MLPHPLHLPLGDDGPAISLRDLYAKELYQRLPKSPTKCQSITVAPYPTAVYGWVNDAVEKEMEVVGEAAIGFVGGLHESPSHDAGSVNGTYLV